MRDQLLIAGALVDGASSLEVVNPATRQVIALAPRASRAQLDEAVAAAHAAFPAWSRTPIEQRRQCLLDIAARVEANIDMLARTLTEEQGKPLREAMGEINQSIAYYRYFATLDLAPRVIEDTATRRVELRRTPLGVTAVIVPWNFPLFMLSFKLPPALLAGNTVVFKPAPTTPLTALRFAALVRDIVPPGVINAITDDNDLGDALTSHPQVRKITFTGSTVTGTKVAQSAAAGLRRVTLELGGNDAAIVLDDVDVAAVAPKLFWCSFRNVGQVCVGIKRLYVQAGVYDRLVAELAKIADAVVVGDGLDERSQIGPIQNQRQFDRVQELLAEARRVGRIATTNTDVDARGYFVRPTVVADIAEGTRLVDEEQFGPVLPVIRFDDVDDALARANATSYALGGSVWSGDVERALALADRLEAGTVWVNQHMVLGANIPLGGAKTSGVGVELGPEGLAEYTQVKVVNIAKP